MIRSTAEKTRRRKEQILQPKYINIPISNNLSHSHTDSGPRINNAGQKRALASPIFPPEKISYSIFKMDYGKTCLLEYWRKYTISVIKMQINGKNKKTKIPAIFIHF